MKLSLLVITLILPLSSFGDGLFKTAEERYKEDVNTDSEILGAYTNAQAKLLEATALEIKISMNNLAIKMGKPADASLDVQAASLAIVNAERAACYHVGIMMEDLSATDPDSFRAFVAPRVPNLIDYCRGSAPAKADDASKELSDLHKYFQQK